MDSRSRPPKRIGSMQRQQISVIGLAKRPVQVGDAKAGPIRPIATAKKNNKRHLRTNFIDP